MYEVKVFTSDDIPSVFPNEFVIPDGFSEIGEEAFAGFCTITKIVIPNTMRKISKSAFEDFCPMLNYYTDSAERVICTLDSQELFLQNAFLFYNNADRILADSKMSNAIVDIKSGVSMIGEFIPPTLGAYIEWWLNCPYNITKDKDGKSMLVYSVAGSILSGYNESKIVYPDGSLSQVNLPNFHGICKMFGALCRKYNDSRVGIEAYTLQEVVDLIK